jgi:phage terminase large subunit-like protein
MAIKRIEQNPYYPLPADYAELDLEGQRKARVNACCQWRLPGSSTERAEAFVASVRFFDSWYLKPDYDAEFDPLFYDDEPLSDPQFHYDILRQWATNRANIAIAPRGAAKSFLVRKGNFLRLVSHPAYSIIYATSTGDNAKLTGQAIKDQLMNNQRLHDDWGPEYPDGRLVPKRGEATFGTLFMQLKNGSWFRAISAESKMRGGRPRRFVLDDPEYDPKASTSMQLIRDYMEVLLFKVVMPMIMRSGCGVDWLATFVSKRHYAWHAMDVHNTPGGQLVARDSRFDFWSRMMIRAEYQDDEGKAYSCWPEMWPIDIEEKERLGLRGRVSLEEIKKQIGTANYLAEYMARPGQGSDIFFPELDHENHGYTIHGDDGLLASAPYKSEARIKWFSLKDEEWQDMPLHEFCKLYRSRMFMTVDTSYTATTDSDFKVCCLMCVDQNLDLFVLDLWSAQVQEPELVRQCFKMADRWKCPIIWPETVREGISIYNALASVVRTRAHEDLTGVSHLPAIKKLNPGRTEKTAKIASLLLRFEQGKIKLPLGSREAPWRRLFTQIDEFNPEAPDGGLQHDDELDTVSMSLYVMRGRAGKPFKNVDEAPKTALDRLVAGETVDETGVPLGLMVDWQRANPEKVSELFRLRTENQGSGRPTKV